MPGVVSYLDHTAIPGKNSCTLYGQEEPIFVSSKVSYAGQSIGVILAETSDQARRAARAVNITYTNKQTPILTIKQALQSPQNVFKKATLQTKPKDINGNSVLYVAFFLIKFQLCAAVTSVEGQFEIGSQYHFHMETQSVIARPVEDLQLQVLAATQWMDGTQKIIAQALGIPENSIDVEVSLIPIAYAQSTETN